MVLVLALVEDGQVVVLAPPAGRGVQVDDQLDAVLAAGFQDLVQLVQLAIDPVVILRQVAVGARLAPVPLDLPTDQVGLPVPAQHAKVLLAESGGRHHASKSRQVMAAKDRPGVCPRRGPSPQHKKHLDPHVVEPDGSAAVLQAQVECSGGRVGRDGDAEGDLLPVEAAVHIVLVGPVGARGRRGEMQHVLDAVVRLGRLADALGLGLAREVEPAAAVRGQVDGPLNHVGSAGFLRRNLHAEHGAPSAGNPLGKAGLRPGLRLGRLVEVGLEDNVAGSRRDGRA